MSLFCYIWQSKLNVLYKNPWLHHRSIMEDQRGWCVRWHGTAVHDHTLDVGGAQFKLVLCPFPAVHDCGQVKHWIFSFPSMKLRQCMNCTILSLNHVIPSTYLAHSRGIITVGMSTNNNTLFSYPCVHSGIIYWMTSLWTPVHG